jgi:hypothetical protein
MKYKNHPTLREAYTSWRLGKAIAKGKVARGRVFPVEPPPPRRGRWEEFKLRARSLRAAIRFLFTQPVRREPAPENNGFAGEVFPTGRLFATLIRDGERVDLGLVSTKVVTTAGVNFIVDAFQNLTEVENFRFHAAGTGTAAEAVGDTVLGTEVETRATGSTTEGASANIYRTVGTVSFTATRAITEHGIFSASTVGVLLDRSQFAAINVINGDSIEFTYDLTFPAGN